MEPGCGLRLLYSGRSGAGAPLTAIGNEASQPVGLTREMPVVAIYGCVADPIY